MCAWDKGKAECPDQPPPEAQRAPWESGTATCGYETRLLSSWHTTCMAQDTSRLGGIFPGRSWLLVTVAALAMRFWTMAGEVILAGLSALADRAWPVSTIDSTVSEVPLAQRNVAS